MPSKIFLLDEFLKLAEIQMYLRFHDLIRIIGILVNWHCLEARLIRGWIEKITFRLFWLMFSK